MSEQDAFPDPESIPLPDEIPVPDDIPLPPEEEEEESVASVAAAAAADAAVVVDSSPLTTNKRQAPDGDDGTFTLNNHDRRLIANQHQNKRVRRDDRANNGHRRNETPRLFSDDLEKEQELMARLMGFSNFDTTKGKMVPGNQLVGAVHVVKKRRYRQYMNRKGGFNRPLDKVP